jgi:hypothetical protein
VRAIALLYWVAGITTATFDVALLLRPGRLPRDGSPPWIALAVLAGCILYCMAAWHLQRLTKLGQVLGVTAAVLSLYGNPLVAVVALWVLLGRRARAVFTDAYRAAVATTPHLDYDLSIVTKVLLGLLLLGMMALALSRLLLLR